MAYTSNTYGGGINIPTVDYTLTKPLNVLGAVQSGIATSDALLDIPNNNRSRKIAAKQQKSVLNDEFKPTDIAIGPNGGLTSKLQDPYTYELGRSLDAAKVQTQQLQGDNFQSQIDRRSALLPGEMDLLTGKSEELGAKTKAILSPEIIETTTPSGETLQVVTSPAGAKEVGKPGSGATMPPGANLGDKILGPNGEDTGYRYGPSGKPMIDRENVIAAQEQKLEADKPKTRPDSKYAPYIDSPKLEQDLQKKWVAEDPFTKADNNIATVAQLRDLATKIISGGPGGVYGKVGDMWNAPEQATFIAKAKEMAQEAKMASVGAQSDADMKLLAMQVPGTDKPLEANLHILDMHLAKNLRARDYSTAITELINDGYSVNQAKGIYKEYAVANPLYTQNGDSLTITKIAPFQNWLQQQKTPPITATVAQARALGLTLTPGTHTIKGKTFITTE